MGKRNPGNQSEKHPEQDWKKGGGKSKFQKKKKKNPGQNLP